MIMLSLQWSVLVAVLLYIWSVKGQSLIQLLMSRMLTWALQTSGEHVLLHAAGNKPGAGFEFSLLDAVMNQTVGTMSSHQDDAQSSSSLWQLCYASLYQSLLSFTARLLWSSGQQVFR